MADRTMRFGETPPTWAADGLAPLARRSKPNLDRFNKT